MKDFDFEIEMQVRDYECDLQGIVNNAVYQNYLEHCRHKFLRSAGLDFARLHDEGIDAVVIRAELDYKFPLRPGDDFKIRLKVWQKGKLRLIFDQEIQRKSDMKIMVQARITAAILKNNKPISPDFIVEHFKKAGIAFEQLPD